MRDTRVSMGTKYMCREGGCGICVVMVTKKIPGTDAVEHLAINSVSIKKLNKFFI